MAEIVGKMACPICGEPNQDIKINKNNKLYMYCDNGCMSRLSSKISRQALAALKAGKSAEFNQLRIKPVTGKTIDNFFFENNDLEEEDF